MIFCVTVQDKFKTVTPDCIFIANKLNKGNTVDNTKVVLEIKKVKFFSVNLEAAWPSDYEGREFKFLFDHELSRPLFNCSVMLVNRRLACLPPVLIFKPAMFI